MNYLRNFKRTSVKKKKHLSGVFLCIALILLSIYGHAQIISQFTWDSNPVTTADIGPNATSVGSSSTSSAGGVGGTNGLNPGLPKRDINLRIPGSPTFDVNGIDISIDYQRDENDARLFERSNNLILKGGNNFSVQYRIDNGAGGFTTVNSGNVYSIPNDATFRTYRFYYLPSTGVAALLVDDVMVWSNDGPDNRNLYWVGAGDVIIGGRMDGSGSNRTALDNLVIASVITAPLPVKLSSFTATLKKNSVFLEWQTDSQLNSKSFNVEHSQDGINWKKIATVHSKHSFSKSPLSYSATHMNPPLGKSYYRLKQIDLDETYQYSNVLDVNVHQQHEILLFPNPAQNQIFILAPQEELRRITIFNKMGIEVTHLTQQSIEDDRRIKIDLSDLPSGIYYVNIGKRIQKIVKQ